jgi:hypothetical protein
MLAFKALRARLGLNTPQHLFAAGLLLALAAAIFAAVLTYNPYAVDWHYTYRPAALAMAAGKSPFSQVKLFFASPWTLIPVIPFALLPEDIGRSLWAVVSIGMFAFIAYRLGGKPVAMLAFLLSAPVANCIQIGNVEWLVLLGYILPPQIGLIFLAMKPHTTLVAILYYVVEAWQKGGIRQALRIVWPVALIGLLSLLIYGLWPLKAQQDFEPTGVFNISIWPQGIPIGLLLMVQSLRSRKLRPAIIASPFLSPFTVLLSWSGAMAAFAASTVEMVTVSIGSWIFWVIFRLSVG